jgi:predicted acylesterase/phospholipase RssA
LEVRFYFQSASSKNINENFSGTSTGGIIAILLGRLKLDVPTSIAIYTELSKVVFKRDRSLPLFGARVPYRKSRFSATVFENEIKKVLIDLGLDENEPIFDKALVNAFRDRSEEIEEDSFSALEDVDDSLVDNEDGTDFESKTASPLNYLRRAFSKLFSATDLLLPNPTMSGDYSRNLKQHKHGDVENGQESDEKGCHCFVVAVHKESLNTPKHFKNFDQHERKTTIWQALRATTAAPTYFDPIALGNPEIFYCDGGTGYNNPCSEVDRVAKSIWGKRTIGIVISIGTGLQEGSSPKRIKWLPNFLHVVRSLVPMATETERVHQDSYHRYNNGHTEYFRFDTHGVSNIGLEEWRKAELITTRTGRYMKQPSRIEKVKNCTECLVKLSAQPKTLEYPATDKFFVGVKLDRTRDEIYRDQQYPSIQPWRREELNIETGWPLGVDVLTEHEDQDRNVPSSPLFRKPFKPGATTGESGTIRQVLPIAQDLDQDGIPNECSIITFIRADTVCVRQLVKDVPPGRYKAKFIVYFFDVEPSSAKDVMSSSTRAFAPSWPASKEMIPLAASNEDSDEAFLTPKSKEHAKPSEAAKVMPPIDLTFNVGKPYDPKTFMKQRIDVHINSDIAPVLLRPDAVRLRVGRRQYKENLEKGWVELGSDLPVNVGRSGTLGFVISKVWREGEFIGGWSFAGVRLVPDFDTEATEQD